jgi:hypothetical protein
MIDRSAASIRMAITGAMLRFIWSANAIYLKRPLRSDKLEQDKLRKRKGEKRSAEKIVNKLRQLEADLAIRRALPKEFKKDDVAELTYYRGGLKVDKTRGLMELEPENAKLERLVSDLSLKKLVFKCSLYLKDGGCK